MPAMIKAKVQGEREDFAGSPGRSLGPKTKTQRGRGGEIKEKGKNRKVGWKTRGLGKSGTIKIIGLEFKLSL